jgi:putative acetyltransferase
MIAFVEGWKTSLPIGMSFAIRKMRPDDARAFLEVHHAAVREIAAKDYLVEVIDAWAPLPITERHVGGVLTNPDSEYRLVAEIEGRVVGIGALVAKNHEVRACYVAPEAGRRGVGSALIREIEREALQRGLKFLEVESSLTAEPFYAAQGYLVLERCEHVLHNGERMACVKMRKRLVSRRASTSQARGGIRTTG